MTLTPQEQANFDRRTKWALEHSEGETPEGYHWIPSPHFNERERGVGDIHGVVIHTTEGWSGGAKTFQRTDRSASTHYGIERSGLVTQMVNEKDRAWHAGSSVNDWAIGIEHAGFADDRAIGKYLGFSEEQLNASAKLVASILKRYQLPPTRAHVFGHAEAGRCKGEPDAKPGRPRLGSTHGGKSCHYDPGPHWDWDRYMKRVRHYYYGGNVIAMAVILGSAALAIGTIAYRGLG
jgi:N-acetyl-anhydromuramyl-L-alanine amidase AmpD